MPRPASLRRREDFERVARTGQVTSGGGVTIHALRREDELVRLGLAIRARGAVTRNRVKRRLRAAVQEVDARGWDLFVRADARASEVDFQELVKMFQRAILRHP